MIHENKDRNLHDVKRAGKNALRVGERGLRSVESTRNKDRNTDGGSTCGVGLDHGGR